MSFVIFWILAVISVGAALLMVVNRNPVRSALYLVATFLALAVFYVTLSAQFVGAVQVIVYAGAIMVLFVFVIMLLNAGVESKQGRSLVVQLLGVPLLVAFLGIMAYFVQRLFPSSTMVHFGGFTGGGVREIGRALFGAYLLPFEVTSILILIAILGAIVLARKEMD